MSWVAITETFVLAAMPSEVKPEYEAWILANPDKSDRLGEIIDSVVADFRAGLSANPSVVMDSETDTLPERCIQHALAIVFYYLSLEIWLSINMSAQTAFINAEVYMRKLYTSDAVVDRDSIGETPSYEPDVTRESRALTFV